jgi:copper chaperone
MRIVQIFIVLLLLSGGCSSGSQKGKSNDQEQAVPVVATENLKTIELDVEGMTCGGCENTVRRKVMESGGIAEVTASHTEKRAVVVFDSLRTTPDQISGAITGAGYEVTGWHERRAIQDEP